MTDNGMKRRMYARRFIGIGCAGSSGLMVLCCGGSILVSRFAESHRMTDGMNEIPAWPISNSIPADPSMIESADPLSADFMRANPGMVRTFKHKIYDTVKTALVHIDATHREVSKSEQQIECDVRIVSPPAPPISRTYQKSIRASGTFVETKNSGKSAVIADEIVPAGGWERLLKVGARPGDRWSDTAKGDISYKFLGFRELQASGAKGPYTIRQAVIEKWRTLSDSKGDETTFRTHYRLQAGEGIVSIRTYHGLKGQPETLLEEKELTSTTPHEARPC